MSATKNLKPLAIKTRKGLTPGSEYAWNKLQDADQFIDSIETPDVDVKNSEDSGRLVSGIPTPFARPAMFRYAMEHVGSAAESKTPLAMFYESLQDEWKGLVACLALDNQPVTVEKVDLVYSDGRGKADTSNLYEPKGALGNMLLRDVDLWCDQVAKTDATRKHVPFIQIIRYAGVVVGGTAPESLLFTAPSYDLGVRRVFLSEKTRKFTDPLQGNLSREEVEKLLVYVLRIVGSVDAYRLQFSAELHVRNLHGFLERWRDEIRDHARGKGYQINENAIVPNLDKFRAPFDKIFNFKTTLYGWGGRISADRATLQPPEGAEPIVVELSELLLDPATSTVAEILLDRPEDAERLGVHLLRAEAERGHRYFTLPLSEKGLAIFQDSIDGLLGTTGDVKSRLTGIYDASTNTLRATLHVDVNDTTTSFEKHYSQPVLVEGQRVICWPNFVSRVWNRYYLYSELPHNSADLKAFPLRADRESFRLLATRDGDGLHFAKVAVNGKRISDDDSARIIVEYDMNKVGSTEIRYEIYESAEPFKGIELQFKTKPAGYVLFRSLTSGNQYALSDYRNKNANLKPVKTGFDFGSNNICISYAEESQKPQLIEFQNRRRCILGVEVLNNDKAAAEPHEVFFFQNERTRSNQVKSMIMTHDTRRVAGFEGDAATAVREVLKGGLPVFEKNIPVENTVDNRYIVRFAGHQHEIRYNLKWSDDKTENAYKEALLKALWLKTYAELLDKQLYPVSLVWAYPSAMSKRQRLQYRSLWVEVGKLNPLNAAERGGEPFREAKVASLEDLPPGGVSPKTKEPKALTEAFSVCKHALQQQIEVTRDSLLIGFDVGGSTTDIICLAMKRDRSAGDDVFQETLIKEGSIKLAAGRLADATAKSPKFQSLLKSFCRKRGLLIHGITVPPDRLNENTAGYYYNLIVDRLQTQTELTEFYQNLAADCPDLFTLNAFMTGLLMFYAGQLARRIRRTQEEQPSEYIEPFRRVTVGCFGKGGRMFDWLRAMSDAAAMNYYKDCFFAGYGSQAQVHIARDGFDVHSPDPAFVKAEVSFGLAGTHEVRETSDQIAELVGEEGFAFNGEPVGEIDAVEGRFLQQFGNQFATPPEFRRFAEFAAIFRDFSKEYFDFSLPTMDRDIRGMRLKAYIDNLPEYRAAKASFEANRVDPQDAQPAFDFVAPIIILEGMCFLETVLSPKLFGR